LYDALLDELEDDGTPRADDGVDLADKTDDVIDLDDEMDDDLGDDGLSDNELDVELKEELLASADELESWSDDPVRMYLTQMGEIPLLTRQQEIALAKEIEITRARFRRRWNATGSFKAP
jgi:RNA polymerase primary sigma factor